MDQATHHKIASFFWGITANILGLFQQGAGGILPMCVLRRLDAKTA